jgi:hypothetical protein
VHFQTQTEEDQWITSHIPELIDELDCHIFVDIVYTVAVFMYLYKYMFKGPDHSQFHVHHNNQGEDAEQIEQQPRNEIKDDVNARYLGSIEAVW